MINPVTKILPKYTAALSQAKTHGADGSGFARDAYNAPDDGMRLDAALRSYNSFDHALTASDDLPIELLVPGLPKYRAGYEAAKTAAELLIASGAVPGARERVGRQEILAARELMHRGVDRWTADRSRYSAYRTLDDLDASLEDAGNGLLMLRQPVLAVPLMRGLKDVRAAVASNKTVAPERVQELDTLFGKVSAKFDALVAAADQTGDAADTTQARDQVDLANRLLRRAADENAAE